MDNKITDIEFVRINKGRSKLCKCKKPHYELDPTNQIVICKDCNAIVNPFEALMTVTMQYERIIEDKRRAINSAEVYQEEANKEFTRMLRSRVFRKMQSSYNQNMFPHCPECGKAFDPIKIDRWTNKNYLT